MANYLEELLDSPEVFVQQDDEFVPVVINNQSYISNQSTARNKLFQYTIEFSPANGRDLESRITNCNPQPEPAPVPPRGPFGEPTWYYNSQVPGSNPTGTWQDTKSVGPDLKTGSITNGEVEYLTNTTVSPYIGDFYFKDCNFITSKATYMFLANSGLEVISGSGGWPFTFTTWVNIKEWDTNSGENRTGLLTYGSTEQPSGAVREVRVETRPSGSTNILAITSLVENSTAITKFPDAEIELNKWYQITLTRNGINYQDHKLYLNDSTAYVPTDRPGFPMNINPGGNKATFLKIGEGGDNEILDGYAANLMYYSGSAVTEQQNAETYQGIKNYLESL